MKKCIDILNTLGECFILINQDLKIVSITDAVSTYYSIDKRDWIGKSIEDILTIQYINGDRLCWMDYLSLGLDIQSKCCLRECFSQDKFSYLRCICYPEKEGFFYGLMIHAIPFFKEDSLLDATKNALEGVSDAVVIISVETSNSYNFVFYNKRFENVFFENSIKVEKASIISFFEKTNLIDVFNKVVHEKNACMIELELKQSIHLQKKFFLNINPVLDDEKNVLFLVLIFKEYFLPSHMDQVSAKDIKLQKIGQLASGIAHDFSNILSIISSYNSLLKIKFAENEAIDPILNNISLAAKKGARLVSNLLFFAGQESHTQEINLGKIVEDTVNVLKDIISKNAPIQMHTQTQDVYINASRVDIEQILVNLCINARDALPQGGNIFIKIEDRHESVSLYVSDDGIGMDAITQRKIFDPFFSTKHPDKGSGLGLSTVYEIIKKIGGTIELESVLGKGTLFKIIFQKKKSIAFEKNKLSIRHNKDSNYCVLVLNTPALAFIRSGIFSPDISLFFWNDNEKNIYDYKKIDLIIIDDCTQEKNTILFLKTISHMHPCLKILIVGEQAFFKNTLQQEGLNDVYFFNKKNTIGQLNSLIYSILGSTTIYPS